MSLRVAALTALLVCLGSVALAKPARPARPVRPAPSAVPSGPIAWYRFDEGRGIKLADSSGNGHAGWAHATYVAGKNGAALAFDGGNYANIPEELLTWGANADFTVEYWLYVEVQKTAEWRSILHHGHNDAERTASQWLVPSGKAIAAALSTDTQPNDYLETGAVPLETWFHFASVKRGGTHTTYIDGQVSATKEVGKSVANSGPVYLGKSPWHPGIRGRMDELRIYDRALTEAELRADIETDAAGGAPPFVAPGPEFFRPEYVPGEPRHSGPALAAGQRFRVIELSAAEVDKMAHLGSLIGLTCTAGEQGLIQAAPGFYKGSATCFDGYGPSHAYLGSVGVALVAANALSMDAHGHFLGATVPKGQRFWLADVDPADVALFPKRDQMKGQLCTALSELYRAAGKALYRGVVECGGQQVSLGSAALELAAPEPPAPAP